MAAGQAIEQLSGEYAGRPVLFLEYDRPSSLHPRYRRFWSAYPDSAAYYPMTIVDSGNQWRSGSEDDYVAAYRQMVEQSLARPPKAELVCYWWRESDSTYFYWRATNRSGETLAIDEHFPSVTLVLYENPQDALGHRWVHAVGTDNLGLYGDLAPDASEDRVTLMRDPTGEISDWSRIDGVAILDFRPNLESNGHDTLQAAVAERIEAPFSAAPRGLDFLVDTDDSGSPSASIQLDGIPYLKWTAEANQQWIILDRDSGSVTQASEITVSRELLSPGWQQGTITYSVSPGWYQPTFEQRVTVRAYYGDLSRTHMPLLVR